MSIVLLIFGLVLFVGLVVVHEFGHFIFARRNGVEIEEFGIGFPPRAWSRQVGKGDKQFIFSLNWLPLGGFVKLKGEHDADTTPGSFGAASTWAKTKIMLAGVGMNIISAYVILVIVALMGMPLILKSVAGAVSPHSPAARAGLQTGDEILAIGSADGKLQSVKSAGALPDLTHQYAGQTIHLKINRDGTPKVLTVTLNSEQFVKNHKDAGYLGVVEAASQRYGWKAPLEAGKFMWKATALTFEGLGKALQGLSRAVVGLATGNSTVRHQGQAEASSQVSGPVGIVVVLKQVSALGLNFVLLIIAIISLTLAIMNVLPIPALDGGRLFVMLMYRLFRRPVNPHTEELIHGIGFMFLMGIFVLVTIVDINRWIV